MEWNDIDKIFPNGFAITPENQILKVSDIKANKMPVVSSILPYYARNMIYKIEEWAWGKNGEFGIASQYDITKMQSHVNDTCPLNVYGMTMLNDYITLNDINLDELPSIITIPQQ